ncbi:hypothetical protein DNTS_005749 [Danionella cerebrum]|uniref:Erythropoietin n=1 Tax=Danionella cerebrum TaxID=2873325 RepID=A0A553RBJ4_9TELE|nr:hypothetical protein DNTS_005749 [Danionella translucida]
MVWVLIVLLWLERNQVSPLHPICDLRVLDHFVREARDSEVIMRGCRGGCGVMQSYLVPLTRVDFAVWEHIDVQEQAAEVQSGLFLLIQALNTAKKAVSNVPLSITLENNISNIHSLNQILQSLHLQQTLPEDSAQGDSWTQRVSTLPDVLQVQSSFLRGKVRLLLSVAPTCQRPNS